MQGFANFLQTQFPKYDLKILNYVSDVFHRNRVSHINFLEREKKRLKRIANAEKKAEKEAKEAEKETTTTTTTTTTTASPPTHSYSMRHRIKIAQYTE